MKRIDKLLDEMRRRYGKKASTTVYFLDGTQKKMTFLEAVQLCAWNENVIDATTEDETGTSLLRAIVDGEHDLSDLPELQEPEE